MSKGGKRKGAGRRPLPASEVRAVRKLYRWTENEHAEIVKTAHDTETTEAVFVRMSVLNKIKQLKELKKKHK